MLEKVALAKAQRRGLTRFVFTGAKRECAGVQVIKKACALYQAQAFHSASFPKPSLSSYAYQLCGRSGYRQVLF